jgi:hypothetical protein
MSNHAIDLTHREAVFVAPPVEMPDGDPLAAEARAVQLSVSRDRPPLVKVVYAGTRSSAWISSARIEDDLIRCRLVDVANGARQCSECGCTDGVACPTGCWWISYDPPVCSNCGGAE